MKRSEYIGKGTFGLTGRPNVLEGIGSIFNLFGYLPDYAYRNVSPEEDSSTMLSDHFNAAGNHLRRAMVEVAREEGYELPNGKKIARQAR